MEIVNDKKSDESGTRSKKTICCIIGFVLIGGIVGVILALTAKAEVILPNQVEEKVPEPSPPELVIKPQPVVSKQALPKKEPPPPQPKL